MIIKEQADENVEAAANLDDQSRHNIQDKKDQSLCSKNLVRAHPNPTQRHAHNPLFNDILYHSDLTIK